MALEAEAALLLTLRVARAYDESGADGNAATFARLAVAIGKYWINKRTPNLDLKIDVGPLRFRRNLDKLIEAEGLHLAAAE